MKHCLDGFVLTWKKKNLVSKNNVHHCRFVSDDSWSSHCMLWRNWQCLPSVHYMAASRECCKYSLGLFKCKNCWSWWTSGKWVWLHKTKLTTVKSTAPGCTYLFGLEKGKEMAGLNKSRDLPMQVTSVKEQTCILRSSTCFAQLIL